jgi:hypothetical protein
MPAQDTYVIFTVDFTASPGTDTAFTMERSTTGLVGSYITIAQNVALLGEVAIFTDTTAPLGVPLFYRATGNVSGTVLTFTEPAVPETGAVYLKDPGRPWADIEMDFCEAPESVHPPECGTPDPEFVWGGFGDETWTEDVGLFPVLNAEYPADVWARRKFLNGSMTFFTRTLDAIDRVYDLFTAGGPLLIQAPSIYGWDDYFVQPGPVQMQRISRDQRIPLRAWSVPFVIVDRPADVPQGTACANWCAVQDAFPTYGDFVATPGTFADLLSGEILCPGGDPFPLITDTFTRTVVDSWGVTDTGQTWTTSGGVPANYDVNGTSGLMSFSVANVTMNAIIPVPGADVSERIDFSAASIPTGATYTVALCARENTTANLYMARVSIADTTGVMTLTLRKRVAAVETQLSTVLPGFSYVANVRYTIRFALVGTSLMAKVWPTLGSEPAAWQTTATDADLVAAGDAGLRVGIGAVTNPLPVILSFDNLRVTI